MSEITISRMPASEPAVGTGTTTTTGIVRSFSSVDSEAPVHQQEFAHKSLSANLHFKVCTSARAYLVRLGASSAGLECCWPPSSEIWPESQ